MIPQRALLIGLRCTLWLGLSVPHVAIAADGGPKITNYQTSGNLEVSHKLGCIGLDEVKTDYTPADLFPAALQCMKTDRFDDAFAIYAVAGVYGRFDSLRVSDGTAHQAVDVIQMTVFGDLNESHRKNLMAAGSKQLDSPSSKQDFCRRLLQLGPPSYYPRYMIQHGMGAFFGGSTGGGLVTPFDAKVAFAKAMDSYLHCPLSNA